LSFSLRKSLATKLRTTELLGRRRQCLGRGVDELAGRSGGIDGLADRSGGIDGLAGRSSGIDGLAAELLAAELLAAELLAAELLVVETAALGLSLVEEALEQAGVVAFNAVNRSLVRLPVPVGPSALGSVAPVLGTEGALLVGSSVPLALAGQGWEMGWIRDVGGVLLAIDGLLLPIDGLLLAVDGLLLLLAVDGLLVAVDGLLVEEG